MAGNCSTCNIKAQNLDPGHKNCKSCIKGLKSDTRPYPGWEAIEEKEKFLCDICAVIDCENPDCNNSVISCHFFVQKTCGNCGKHWEHVATYAYCEDGAFQKTEDTYEATDTCQWKPIKPVCEKCGGTGEVKDYLYIGIRAYWKPCPACSEPEKEET